MTSPVGFRIDWVLVNELAIGPAPRQERHLVLLKSSLKNPAISAIMGQLPTC